MDLKINCRLSRALSRFSKALVPLKEARMQNEQNEEGIKSGRQKGRKNRKRREKRDRRLEEEESRYHNIAVIPGSVSFQIIQKPADRTYIPGPTRSSHRVIIVEGPNRP